MEKSRSEKSIEGLAATLFDVSNDGRAHIEYPFLFIALVIGFIVRSFFNHD